MPVASDAGAFPVLPSAFVLDPLLQQNQLIVSGGVCIIPPLYVFTHQVPAQLDSTSTTLVPATIISHLNVSNRLLTDLYTYNPSPFMTQNYLLKM